MRVAGIEEFGGSVTVLEVPDPRALRTGEVLIEVKAAGVGNWDEFARTGPRSKDAGRRGSWRRPRFRETRVEHLVGPDSMMVGISNAGTRRRISQFDARRLRGAVVRPNRMMRRAVCHATVATSLP